ncbi:hypothetical protein [Mycobacterium sp. pUA109]|uniref:hypothetical protein n=1 Tax=Mycobacterium sp. pUA109 TaxID=3238982 RepID=UPI00351B9D02
MLIGGRTAVRGGSGDSAAGSPVRFRWSRRRGALALGSVAALAMGIVGCTSIITGTATVDTSAAPAYRTSMSKSLSASAATSSSRESQRQQSLTTQAISGACGTFRSSSEDAVTATNNWVDAYNKGGDTGGTSGPAVDALNRSADAVAGAMTDAMPQGMRDTFNSYIAAARSVADAIATHAAISVYNSRKDQLNQIKGQGFEQCRPFP